MAISKSFSMTKTDWNGLVDQAIIFSIPICLMYLTPITISITEAMESGKFVFSWDYFVPSQIVVGGIILFLVNRVLDFLRRYVPKHML